MRIKKEYLDDKTKLMELGFEYGHIYDYWWDDNECEENENQGEFIYNLGHSRRGQFYYLVIEKDGCIDLYATKPDGDGGSIGMKDIIIKLYENGMIEI